MGWIELSEEDRKRYGAPERIQFDYSQFGAKSIDAMEQAPIEEDGRGWTYEDLGNALQRTVIVDGKEVTRPRPMAIAVVVWLALRGNGVRVAWNDFELHFGGLRISWTDEVDDEGKAGEPAPAEEDRSSA